MSKHIVNYTPKPDAKKRLFCFPYAGGGAGIFRLWGQLLPADIELYAVELPGRVHLREPAAKDMKELIDIIFPEIEPLLDKPFAFFAHSYGSIVAYELTRRLQEMVKTMPEHVIVSARRAPHIASSVALTAHLPDSEFVAAMQNQFGAIPQAVLHDKSLLAMFLPILREDIRLNENYLGSVNPPLTVPLTVFSGVDDKSGATINIDKWKETTIGPYLQKQFPGGHFYIDSARQEVIQEIAKILS